MKYMIGNLNHWIFLIVSRSGSVFKGSDDDHVIFSLCVTFSMSSIHMRTDVVFLFSLRANGKKIQFYLNGSELNDEFNGIWVHRYQRNACNNIFVQFLWQKIFSCSSMWIEREIFFVWIVYRIRYVFRFHVKERTQLKRTLEYNGSFLMRINNSFGIISNEIHTLNSLKRSERIQKQSLAAETQTHGVVS